MLASDVQRTNPGTAARPKTALIDEADDETPFREWHHHTAGGAASGFRHEAGNNRR